MITEENKPLVIEKYADNGMHSHYELIDPETGELLWSQIEEDEQRQEVVTHDTVVIRHIDDWHEDIGDCLWWEDMDSAMGEAAQYIGSPICSDWPSYLRNGNAVFVPHPKIRV